MEHCSLAQAERVARAICRAIEDYQYVWEDRTFRVGCSIGLVPISGASQSAANVMSSADTACYAAKDRGRGRVHVYHPGDEELAKRHGEMQWAVRINHALEENRFRLFYQPIAPIQAPNRERQLDLVGVEPPSTDGGLHFELLIRLEEYDGTLTPPGAFLPAAERYNLSVQLDRWVCDSAIGWLADHPKIMDQVSVCSINLSGHSLGDAGLLQHLARRFDRGDINPGRFCFEITETAAISNLAAATHFIRTLGERGCLFALDDFGRGLSSFAYLKTLPVHFLKIDGLFVKDIVDDPIYLAMVKSINEIGQVMGKRTVAEFVESQEILAELSAIGVDYAQGYAIARPMPIENLLEFEASPAAESTGELVPELVLKRALS
jgi:EAL domain-containing protein (putative c-di-GMP-specific phosphodiesterase class I)